MRIKIILSFLSIAIGYAFGHNRILIPIQTDDTGLYLMVNENGELKQLYFGERLKVPSEMMKMKVVGHDAFPAFGIGSEAEHALQIYHADGNPTTRLIYVNHSEIRDSLDSNVLLTNVNLRDEYYPLFVTLNYKVFLKENVIETWAEIMNKEDDSVRLGLINSAYLNIKANKYFLTHFYGTQNWEMNMIEEPLMEGIKIIDQKRITRSHNSNPSFMLSLGHSSEKEGRVIAGAMAWSGNYRLAFQIDNCKYGVISAGINNFVSDYILDSQNIFVTPKFVFTYSNEGKGLASRNLHSWARKYVLRPIPESGLPVVLNNWEGTGMNFDEKTILKIIDDAAGLGAEMFVLDDGWFGNKYPRNDSKNGLGDWEVNRNKLPNGLTPLIERCKQNKIKFGLWVEPEMVNTNSEFLKKHPNWIVRTMNRTPLLEFSRGSSQHIIDLSNPKVQDFIFGIMDKLLSENPEISYIKWDCNKYAHDFGSTYLDGNYQQNLWVDYIKGYYGILNRLTNKYPQILWQACSSGGGRLDYGSLDYSHEYWPSDNTDAWSRVFLQWGSNMIYPAIATASHISASPNQQTGHITPLKMRIDVAMSGRLGVELQPVHMTAAEKDVVKNAIEEYKKYLRPVVQFGDLYRLVSPYEESHSAIEYVSPDKTRAALFVYSVRNVPKNHVPIIPLDGLNHEKDYKIIELNVSDRKTSSAVNGIFSGDYLMKYGISVNVTREYESCVLYLQEVE